MSFLTNAQIIIPEISGLPVTIFDEHSLQDPGTKTLYPMERTYTLRGIADA